MHPFTAAASTAVRASTDRQAARIRAIDSELERLHNQLLRLVEPLGSPQDYQEFKAAYEAEIARLEKPHQQVSSLDNQMIALLNEQEALFAEILRQNPDASPYDYTDGYGSYSGHSWA